MTRRGEKVWEKLSSEYIIQNRWLCIRRDNVQLANGAVIDDFYVQEAPDWILVIAITEEGKYIIERQYRHGTQQTYYELCGGHVDKGEDPLLAAKRELLEETGYGVGEWTLLMTSTPNPSAMTTICNAFVAKDVRKIKQQNQEKTEDIDVLLLDKDEVMILMERGEIAQGDMLAALWRWMYSQTL